MKLKIKNRYKRIIKKYANVVIGDSVVLVSSKYDTFLRPKIKNKLLVYFLIEADKNSLIQFLLKKFNLTELRLNIAFGYYTNKIIELDLNQERLLQITSYIDNDLNVLTKEKILWQKSKKDI